MALWSALAACPAPPRRARGPHGPLPCSGVRAPGLDGKTVSGTLSRPSWVPHCVFQSELRNRLGHHFAELYGLHVFMA
jgi:hypothetical protein